MVQGGGELHCHDCIQSTFGQVGSPQDKALDESKTIVLNGKCGLWQLKLVPATSHFLCQLLLCPKIWLVNLQLQLSATYNWTRIVGTRPVVPVWRVYGKFTPLIRNTSSNKCVHNPIHFPWESCGSKGQHFWRQVMASCIKLRSSDGQEFEVDQKIVDMSPTQGFSSGKHRSAGNWWPYPEEGARVV